MCTVSIVTRDDGYLLGMNRDEKITRGPGEAPQIHNASGIMAIYPGDGAGGTWIAANEFGAAFALLNWNDLVPAVVETRERRSRGQVIPAVIACSSIGDLYSLLSGIQFQGVPPFRLIGIFPDAQQIREWRWDSVQMESLRHPWTARHWFSSSLSDKQASVSRGQICAHSLVDSDAGSKTWLRRLHASHQGGPGPFGLCVHRPDVATLSYTEIEVADVRISLTHSVGSPCLGGRFGEIAIRRSVDQLGPPAICN